MKIVLVLITVLLSNVALAGAVDDCIDSIGQGKLDCGVKSVKPGSDQQVGGLIQLCADDGVSCGPMCERTLSGSCKVKGVMAKVIKKGCADEGEKSIGEEKLCHSLKTAELK